MSASNLRRYFRIRKYVYGSKSYKYTHWVARHLPHRLIYWCTIVLMARVTSGDTPLRGPIPEIKAMDALRKYEQEHHL